VLVKDDSKLAGNFQRRLKRLEQQVAQIAKRNPQAICNCRRLTVVARPEYFAAEMNQTCPVHGFRSLGQINVMEVTIVGENSVEYPSAGLTELLEDYKRRLARHRQEVWERRKEDDDDSAEL
jgi:hypothetical protein